MNYRSIYESRDKLEHIVSNGDKLPEFSGIKLRMLNHVHVLSLKGNSYQMKDRLKIGVVDPV